MMIERRPAIGAATVATPLRAVRPGFARDVLTGVPVRKFGSYRDQPHKPGFYWFEALRRHVRYESNLERSYLMWVDFQGGVTHVLPQPVVLRFGRDSVPRRHIPDFLVAFDHGGVELVDVKPAELATRKTSRLAFTKTQRVCDQLGWEFIEFTGLRTVVLRNLEYLAGFRNPLLGHADDHVNVLEDVVGDATTVQTVSEALIECGVPKYVAPAVLWRAAWNRTVSFRLDEPLNPETQLTLTNAGGER